MKYIGLVLIFVASLIPSNEPKWKQILIGIMFIVGTVIWITP